MKTKTIEVKFPTIEGMKVENASVDLKNGVSIVEYVEEVKFKKGDIVYYSDSDGTWICVLDYETMSSTQYIVMLNAFNKLYFNNYMDVICQRLATDSEKQLLFDALEEEGKYWDSENLEVKELSLSDRIDRIAFDSKNMSIAEISKKIKNIINKEVEKAVNEIYK